MAPNRRTVITGQTTSEPSTGTATPGEDAYTPEAFAALRQELEEARAQAQTVQEQLEEAQTTNTQRNQSAGNTDANATAIALAVAQAVAQALAQNQTQSSAPPAKPAKSEKVPDPPVLTDGTDPPFEPWRSQMEDKLRINADRYPTDDAQKAYVYSRTGGHAQKHLQPRYSGEVSPPFSTAKEMIQYLASIYRDPNRVENARREYRKLYMKGNQAFNDFYTQFLHLAGEGRIPADSLREDLWDKISLDIRQALLGVKRTLDTLEKLKEACQSIDNDLRQIKELRSRTANRRNALATTGGRTTSAESRRTPQTPTAQTPAVQSLSRTQAPTQTSAPDPARPRPTYDDPRKQALSKQGACFNCGIPGHLARDCKVKKEAATVEEVVEVLDEASSESGNEEP